MCHRVGLEFLAGRQRTHVCVCLSVQRWSGEQHVFTNEDRPSSLSNAVPIKMYNFNELVIEKSLSTLSARAKRSRQARAGGVAPKHVCSERHVVPLVIIYYSGTYSHKTRTIIDIIYVIGIIKREPFFKTESINKIRFSGISIEFKFVYIDIINNFANN